MLLTNRNGFRDIIDKQTLMISEYEVIIEDLKSNF